MTVDDRGEGGGGRAYLVRPDDVISGKPPTLAGETSHFQLKRQTSYKSHTHNRCSDMRIEEIFSLKPTLMLPTLCMKLCA